MPFGAAQGAPAQAPIKLTFSVHRYRSRIDFSFILSGRVPVDVQKIQVPQTQDIRARRRRDELWKSTCFEIFVGPADGVSYLELNMAPAGDWNVYAFDRYRTGMRPVEQASPLLLAHERSQDGDHLIWHGSLQGPDVLIEGLHQSPALVMSATAVLEYKTGHKEYWATAHAGEQPDFHLRDSFRLAL